MEVFSRLQYFINRVKNMKKEKRSVFGQKEHYAKDTHTNTHNEGSYGFQRASQVVLVVNNSPANARPIRDVGSIPRLGRFLEGGHGNPIQYSYLENPMGRGTWQATVH